jgi:hypothetical protein
VLATLRDLLDRIRHEAVGLLVHGQGCGLAGRFGQAHDRAAGGVEPIVEVLDLVFGLRGEILLVGAGDVLGGDL